MMGTKTTSTAPTAATTITSTEGGPSPGGGVTGEGVATWLYALLAWTSPAFPIGAYTYSHGIEYAVETGAVKNRDTLASWVGRIVSKGAGFLDAVLFAEAWRAAGDATRLDELADLATALRGTSEMALESSQQGASFLLATAAAWPHPALDAFAERHGGRAALPIAFAIAAAGRVPLEPALTAYLHGMAANLISAGVRLVPLGQTDGQRALAALAPVVAATAARAIATPIEEAGSAAPMVDWTSMRHESQYTRLFRS